MAPRKRVQPSRFVWHRRASPARIVSGCQVVQDSRETAIPALDWLGGEGRDVQGSAERRAEQLIDGNRGLLRDLLIVHAGKRVSCSLVGWPAYPRASPLPLRPHLASLTTFDAAFGSQYADHASISFRRCSRTSVRR